MDYKTNPIFKLVTTCVSFILLAPSVYDAYLMAHMLIAIGGRKFHDEFFEKIEYDWSKHCCWYCGANCFLIFCCPCSWCCLFCAQGCSSRCLAAIIGTTDIAQCFTLFYLTIVVIWTSETSVDIFVNVVAVQVFANLDDLFAYAISNRRMEIWKETSKLYIKWIGERKTPDHVDVSAFKALSEKVLEIEKMMKPVDNKSLTVVDNEV